MSLTHCKSAWLQPEVTLALNPIDIISRFYSDRVDREGRMRPIITPIEIIKRFNSESVDREGCSQ